MCTQKVLTQKTILPIEKLEDPDNRFIGQNTFWLYLLLRSDVHFWIFWYPIRTIQRNFFYLIEYSMGTFYELTSPKCKQPHNTSYIGFL